jgi:hypothetical protein
MCYNKFEKTFFLLMLMLLILIMSWTCTHAQEGCPIAGDNPRPHLQHQDSLKNSSFIPFSYTRVDFSWMADLKVTDKYLYQTVSLHGYVLEVKFGGSETANCHSKNKSVWDTHIVLVSDSLETNPCHGIVCEVTYRIRQQKPNLTTENLKKTILHHWVTIEGYLFNDDEHKAMSNADDCHPNNCHRATCWEIHPVCEILTD